MIKSGSVIFSKSRNIYSNLALEEWLYNNLKCTENDCSFLLMWQNKPAVVIGKHQNPWLECNTKFIRKNNMDLARRSSGGGTVYHDMGNLNLSFFTPRSKYNRNNNLGVICETLKKWGLHVIPSERHDLLLNNFKISGTASKLGRENAYHHCTLLLNVNSFALSNSLHQDVEMKEVTSKATQSIRSSIQNLKDVCPNLDSDELLKEIARVYQLNKKDYGFLSIDPSDEIYVNLNEIESRLRGWEWIFGKTPRFTLNKSFLLNKSNETSLRGSHELSIEMTIFHGRIESLKSNPYPELTKNLLVKTKFDLYDMKWTLEKWLSNTKSKDLEIKELIAKCIIDMVSIF